MKLLLYLSMKLIMNAGGIVSSHYSRQSPLLASYGCLVETNITVFIPKISYKNDADFFFQLFSGIEDACNTIFYFAHNLRDIVKWEGRVSDSIEGQRHRT